MTVRNLIVIGVLLFCTIYNQLTFLDDAPEKLTVLHLSFHQGCINEINFIADQLDLDLTTLSIFDLPREDWDEQSPGFSVYNMGHDRAARIWEKYKPYFELFDVIITSDTAPLSRIFLQHGWNKPLIIWICNRFDWVWQPALDCKFPDQEYYALFQGALFKKNVQIICYTPFEYFYAEKKGLKIGRRVIKPTGGFELVREGAAGLPPIIPDIDKPNTLFIYPRLTPEQLGQVEQDCAAVGLATWSGSYRVPADLAGFKGVLYFPYQWSNLAFFENIHHGIVHFVPSIAFVQNRAQYGPQLPYTTISEFPWCEWYADDNKDIIVYFDSWQDLKHKVDTLDYGSLKQKIKKQAIVHTQEMVGRWKGVFSSCY